MDRYQSARITGILGIVGNIFLLIIKVLQAQLIGYEGKLKRSYRYARRLASSKSPPKRGDFL